MHEYLRENKVKTTFSVWFVKRQIKVKERETVVEERERLEGKNKAEMDMNEQRKQMGINAQREGRKEEGGEKKGTWS